MTLHDFGYSVVERSNFFPALKTAYTILDDVRLDHSHEQQVADVGSSFSSVFINFGDCFLRPNASFIFRFFHDRLYSTALFCLSRRTLMRQKISLKTGFLQQRPAQMLVTVCFPYNNRIRYDLSTVYTNPGINKSGRKAGATPTSHRSSARAEIA